VTTTTTNLVGEEGGQVDTEVGGGAGEAEKVPVAAEADGGLEPQPGLTVDGVAQQAQARLAATRVVEHRPNPAD